MEDQQATAIDDRVAFGPKHWQTMPPEVASMMLTLWRERQPAVFGAYLAEVMTDVPPSGPARKARKP